MNSIPGYAAPFQPISAVDALAPAFRRTRSILAAPFRIGFFLKICFFVALAESSFLSASFSYPVQATNAIVHARGALLHPGSSFLGDGLSVAGALGAGMLLIFLALAVIGMVIACIVVYLQCRLRFTILDLAIYRQGRIGRAWSKYGRQTWRYFGLTILAGLLFLLMIAAVIGPFIPAFIRIGRTMDPSHPDPLAMLGLLLPVMAAIVVLSLIGLVVEAAMRDFLLPPMAIEDASIESALRRFFGLLRKNFGGMALYLFLRTLVSVAISAGLGIVLIIPVAILGVLAFAVGVPLYHLLWQGNGQLFFVIYATFASGIVLFFYFLAIVTIFGVTGMFKLCYSVVFFGGRYPALGSLLEPESAPSPVLQEAPPPLPPSDLPLPEPPPVW